MSVFYFQDNRIVSPFITRFAVVIMATTTTVIIVKRNDVEGVCVIHCYLSSIIIVVLVL